MSAGGGSVFWIHLARVAAFCGAMDLYVAARHALDAMLVISYSSNSFEWRERRAQPASDRGRPGKRQENCGVEGKRLFDPDMQFNDSFRV